MRLASIRTAIMMLAVALVTGTSPANAVASVSGDLYYFNAGYIMRVPAADGTPEQVVRVGNVSISGMAIADGRLFWVTDDGASEPLSYITLGGTPHVTTMVTGLNFPVGLVAAGGWLYWADQDAIGRIRPDGAQLTRRFIVLPQEDGGGIAEGLAAAGATLYFTRCQDSEIGQVGDTGASLDMHLITLPRYACPQQLAAAGDHLYWTELGGYIGRAAISGSGASDTWLNIRETDGPFNVAADGSSVYWDWGGAAGTPEYVGTARANGTGVRTRFVTGQGAFAVS
jgi:hypothetical protein